MPTTNHIPTNAPRSLSVPHDQPVTVRVYAPMIGLPILFLPRRSGYVYHGHRSENPQSIDDKQPMTGRIAFVNADGTVNVGLFDHYGRTHNACNVIWSQTPGIAQAADSCWADSYTIGLTHYI